MLVFLVGCSSENSAEFDAWYNRQVEICIKVWQEAYEKLSEDHKRTVAEMQEFYEGLTEEEKNSLFKILPMEARLSYWMVCDRPKINAGLYGRYLVKGMVVSEAELVLKGRGLQEKHLVKLREGADDFDMYGASCRIPYELQSSYHDTEVYYLWFYEEHLVDWKVDVVLDRRMQYYDY